MNLLRGRRAAAATPMHWFDAAHVSDVRGSAAVPRRIDDLIEYLCANDHELVNWTAPPRSVAISTAFVERTVNEILPKRMIKKQQM